MDVVTSCGEKSFPGLPDLRHDGVLRQLSGLTFISHDASPISSSGVHSTGTE